MTAKQRRYPFFCDWYTTQPAEARTAITWLLRRGRETSNPLLKDLYRRCQEFLLMDKAGDMPNFPGPLSPKQVEWLTKSHAAWLRVRNIDESDELLDSTVDN